MSAQPLERVDNLGGGGHCRYCCRAGMQTGWVMVGTSEQGTDMMAPCPYCERGYKIEFPDVEWARFGKSWGPTGYWQGRDPSREGVVAACACEVPGRLSEQPLSVQENRIRLWLLTRRHEQLAAGMQAGDSKLSDPNAGLELGSEKERIAVLHREVARVEVLRDDR